MRVFRSLLIGLCFVCLAGVASAGTMTELYLDSCNDLGCEGSTLRLNVDDQGDGTFLVTYTINVSGYTGDRTGFNQIGWKAIQGASSVDLLSAEGGLGSWSDPTESTVASNSTCDHTDGSTDKWCIDGFAALNGGDMVFTYLVTGGTLLDTGDWALSAQYADAVGETQGRIISAHAPAIPEPSAAVLFGLGAVIVAGRTRRR